ncbi:hypothetical protein AVEN_27356-1 [Araneus ventricosus]|uniref:Uncharacterized protein n=1 Tax=Araneus ventricosus TaxID=182803 RepID=A0A4Y2IS31_ARAVE|nr:hypothetical protein AVEN_27356-1 [Araneus ventricosus]
MHIYSLSNNKLSQQMPVFTRLKEQFGAEWKYALPVMPARKDSKECSHLVRHLHATVKPDRHRTIQLGLIFRSSFQTKFFLLAHRVQTTFL